MWKRNICLMSKIGKWSIDVEKYQIFYGRSCWKVSRKILDRSRIIKDRRSAQHIYTDFAQCPKRGSTKELLQFV